MSKLSAVGDRAIIFVNGQIDDYDPLASWLDDSDYIVAADGGLNHCLVLNVTPDVIVGDLDSAPPEQVKAMQARGVAVESHPPVKDQTDLELAIERALRDGASEIWLVGALGGRLDQTLANLLILAQREWPVPIRVVEGDQHAQLLRDGQMMTLVGEIGSTVSILPLSADVTGITFTGLRYPLENATLTLGSTRGVSNEMAEETATIRIDDGTLLVVQTKMADTDGHREKDAQTV